MIDPRAVTKFDRSNAELEEFLLFCIVVAGKNAFQQTAKLEQFLQLFKGGHYSPLEVIQTMNMDGTLDFHLRSVKMGQYERIGTAFRGVSEFFSDHVMGEHQLRYVPVSTLECVKGIGMKTSRFFAMHTRPNQQYACLDTHILKWLGEKGHEVPKTTPRGQKYSDLEKIFLAYCKDMNILPATLDLSIWNERHQNEVKEQDI